MSRAGDADGGFTLLELLVVLTIMALLAAVALPRVGTLLRPDIDRTSQRVALLIRDYRSAAMRSGRMATVTAATVAPLLPRGTVVAEGSFGAAGAVTFFPDGTSTGGRLLLAAGDGRRGVDVDWLTGGVRVERLP
jgi:general secretion pathway protein H